MPSSGTPSTFSSGARARLSDRDPGSIKGVAFFLDTITDRSGRERTSSAAVAARMRS